MATETHPERIAEPRPWLAVRMLAWREVIRFARQPNRVVGAVGQPILFWLLFGVGLRGTFQLAAADGQGPTFLEYYFPGTLVLILLFTAIFATISIIEDRREGFLQSVLVAPLPRWSIALGKVFGGAAIAVVQGLIFLLLALTLEVEFGFVTLLQLAALLSVAAIGLTALGFVIAWRMESTQGFHAIMNLALMPMWLLSGAFFPVPELDGQPWGQVLIHWLMRLNPLTYTVAGVRRLLYDERTLEELAMWLPSLGVCWTVTVVSGVAALAVACRMAGQRTTGDLL